MARLRRDPFAMISTHRSRTMMTLALALAGGAGVWAGEAGPSRVAPVDKVSVAITDFTEAGEKLPAVSAAAPVYFIGVNAGHRDYNGSVLANDPPPPDDKMLRVITEVLSEQGYRAADATHPPSQILVCSWGTIAAGAGDGFISKKRHVIRAKAIPGNLTDLFLDPGRYDGHKSTYEDLARYHLYAILIRAYDFKALETGKYELLWETRIACGANGISLKTALPGLVVAGRHSIGRDTPRPIVVNAARQREAWVEIGESRVVEYIDATPRARSRPPPVGPDSANGKK